MLGFIGGINELLKLFGHLMFGFFANRYFFYKVLSRLYHVESLTQAINHHEENNNKAQNIKKLELSKQSITLLLSQL